MKHKITLSIATFTLLILTGCGGGGSSTPQAASKTGFVGDGYIEGAYVCHDSDGDWDCLNETYATTAADGSFTLSNYDQTLDLLVQVPVGAVDNGPFADGTAAPRPFSSPTWYVYPANANPGNAPIFVGPLSTLVYAQVNAIPGTSVDEATEIVATGVGVDADVLMGNYLETNSTETNGTVNLHVLAEITGGALTNSVTTTGTQTQPNFDVVLADIDSIATTASEANTSSSSYNPAGYTPTGGTTASSLAYSPVLDLHVDLENCNYYAFEEWDGNSASTPNEHKNLCLTTDADTGEKVLKYTEYYYNALTWTMDTLQTSGQLAFLSRPTDTLVDMDNVNSQTGVNDIYPLRFFPAVEQSHSGSGAVFKSGIFEYKLIVSQSDISGLSGAVLPQGSTVGPLVDNTTFGAGDKLYKATMLTQNKVFRVDNGYNFFSNQGTPSTHPENYKVYDEGTMGGAGFVPMPDTSSITTLAGLTDTDFIVNYQDSSNFDKISITAPYNPNALNMLQIEHITNGSNGGVALSGFYSIETHNGTPFLIIPNFFSGPNRGLFIGKVDSIDANSYIYGEVISPYTQIDVTEGGYQHGDIMDDIMLNTSARTRLFTDNALPAVP